MPRVTETSQYADIIRSVGVARALLERFDELMKGPSMAARFGQGLASQVSGDGANAALELRVGEAQQIYPDIWSNLDDARRALRAANIKCTEYDVIRKEQTVVGVVAGNDGGGVAMGFNTRGAAQARQALRAIETVTPVDWQSIKAADTALAESAMSLGRGNRVIGVIGVLLALGLVAGLVLFIRAMFLSV